MATTPPPTSRVHTPPAPRHGARLDDWEPFAPRRSTRTSTPRKNNNSLRRELSSQTLSPPPSPAARPSPVRRQLFDSLQSHKHTPQAMLPTPKKTPHKPDSSLAMPSPRRLNFRPGNLEDVMPTPRKQRKSRLTLFDDDAPQPDTVAVFTDAQCRVPDLDPSEENPFLGPRKKGPKPQLRKKLTSSKPNDADLEINEADMEEAVKNDQGLIYVFRGKKFFRSFSDADHNTANSALDQSNLKRKAGVAADRPFTRSSLKPVLLWPSDDDKNASDAALNDDDEEADTDIEQEQMPLPMPKFNDLVTPAKKIPTQPDALLTPPSTHRATRSAAKKLEFLSSFDPISESPEVNTPASPDATPKQPTKAGVKRDNPFHSWHRTKTHASISPSTKQGKKRAFTAHEDDYVGTKRSRSVSIGPGA